MAANWEAICVFAGSNSGIQPVYAEQAQRLGEQIARSGWNLVYGAGRVGLMGVVADAVLAAGGTVTGVIPEFLAKKELLHTGLTKVQVTQDMHERKAAMARQSDAFLALPGGLGTFEELFEVLTWAQLGVHTKPIGLLNCGQFYDPILTLIDHAVEAGFIRPEHRELFIADADVESLLQKMQAYVPPELPKWADLEKT